MAAMASQITGVSIVSSTVCSGADQRKHQSFASLAFFKGIQRWPVYSPQRASNAENVTIWWLHNISWALSRIDKKTSSAQAISLELCENKHMVLSYTQYCDQLSLSSNHANDYTWSRIKQWYSGLAIRATRLSIRQFTRARTVVKDDIK